MKMYAGLVTLAVLAGTAAGAVAPTLTGEYGFPTHLYFDVQSQTYIAPVGDDPFIYNKKIEIPYVKVIGPKGLDVPPPPEKTVADDGHGAGGVLPLVLAVDVTQLTLTFHTTGTVTRGTFFLYSNDATNSDLPDFAAGSRTALAQLDFSDIPAGPGTYCIHMVNIVGVTLPSQHFWLASRLECDDGYAVPGVGEDPGSDVGSSLDEIAWEGDLPTYPPGSYDFGGDPKADFLMSLSGFTHCPSDFDRSGFVDLNDFVGFLNAFEDGTNDADMDGTGFVDFEDYISFIGSFLAGC